MPASMASKPRSRASRTKVAKGPSIGPSSPGNRIKRLVNRRKQFRRLATRDERRMENDRTIWLIAATLLWLRTFEGHEEERRRPLQPKECLGNVEELFRLNRVIGVSAFEQITLPVDG